MKLNKLFSVQKEYNDQVKKEHSLQNQNLLSQEILALQVKVGQSANEWRGFKFWSEDRAPRTEYICKVCEGSEEISRETAIGHPEDGYDVFEVDVNCPLCEDVEKDKNPLLEEYVDCLSFILSIGLYDPRYKRADITPRKMDSVLDQFIYIGNKIGDFACYRTRGNYQQLINYFLGLGRMLQFTDDQIEEAYLCKFDTKNHKSNAELKNI
ncbi:dUTP diphosphatase [Virgibacillus salexigens]|uniref:dUTPase n=1 Tax=Virgibacillus massiliensis TaxID=1462526 RepID=A0A024QHG5_9BACI|nr:dUTP diphosphatase [Virgibacillus massiliensis]CDQ41934.1 dUTPase [Virgibacillus massiliensis]